VVVRSAGVGVLALGLGLALVLLRGDPYVASDQGVFLSVAGRMLDGDHLYAEVFDNKDPLFFYTYAGALWVGGWRGPFLLDAIWVGLAGVSVALLARRIGAPRSAGVASFFVYPLALTAGWYLVGLSMLAALAVVPLAPWFWLRGRFAWAGVVVAVVMLLKLNLAPLALAPLGALVALGAPEERRRRALAQGVFGLGGALAAASAFLGVRGELGSYLGAITHNVHYSSARTTADGTVGRAVEHLRVAWDFFYRAGRWQAPLAVLVLVAFAVAFGLAWARGTRPERLLGAVAAATLVSAFAVLALTAYWWEHLQLLACPATLVAASLIWRADASFGRRSGAVAATVVTLFAGWSTLKDDGSRDVSTLWTSPPISPGAIALERARERFQPEARRVTYMVLGSNSEGGHAAFIDRKFDLACRYFHLYVFSRSEEFDDTLACASRESPTFVLVTLGFFEPAGNVPEWNTFVMRSRRLLEAHYEVVEREYPGVQVWKRRSA
jgi:hypothetical protein